MPLVGFFKDKQETVKADDFSVQLFRLNKHFPVSLINVKIKDPFSETAISYRDETYRYNIQLYNEIGQLDTVASLSSKAKIINASHIIFDVGATEQEQIADMINYLPQVSRQQPPRKTIPKDDSDRKSVNKGASEAEGIPEEDEEIRNLKKSIKERKKSGKKSEFADGNFIRGKDGEMIPKGSTIKGKMYCLRPGYILEKDETAYFERLNLLDTKNEIDKLKDRYEKKLNKMAQTHKVFVEELERRVEEQEKQIYRLKLGMNGNGERKENEGYNDLFLKRKG